MEAVQADVAEAAAILTAQTTLKVVVVVLVTRHALLTAKIALTTLEVVGVLEGAVLPNVQDSVVQIVRENAKTTAIISAKLIAIHIVARAVEAIAMVLVEPIVQVVALMDAEMWQLVLGAMPVLLIALVSVLYHARAHVVKPVQMERRLRLSVNYDVDKISWRNLERWYSKEYHIYSYQGLPISL